jgi:hypothetical protein
MNHLGFILAAYAIGVSVPSAFIVAAWIRMARAAHRLRTVEPRRQRNGSRAAAL